VYLKTTLVFIIILVFGVLVDKLPGAGWLNFISKILIYGLIFLAAFYYFVINKEEQLMIKRIVNIKR
jgi:Zn-dependent protease with chaperone function